MVHLTIDGIYIRIGEALSPGPVQPELVIGAMNPSGIMHKLDQLQELPTSTRTIYGVCESHLSKPGIAKFQRSLKLVKSHFRFHAGAPAPLRSTSFTAIGGKHTGTGWLSNTPTRPLHPMWSDDDWNEARFAMHSFLVNDQWLTGGVFYGYAQQAATQEGRNHTNALMEKVIDRLLVAKGKRFLVGDFNQEYDVLEQPKRLYDQEWRECQILRKEKYARPISKTCRKTTTKDFIWICPELIPFFHKVETCDQFPDHLTLYAEFTNLGKPPKSFVWRQPRAINLSKNIGILPETATHINPDDCMQKQLETIAKGFEDVVNDQMRMKTQKGLQTCRRGRSLTSQTKVIQDHTRPLQPTRHGHARLEYH